MKQKQKNVAGLEGGSVLSVDHLPVFVCWKKAKKCLRVHLDSIIVVLVLLYKDRATQQKKEEKGQLEMRGRFEYRREKVPRSWIAATRNNETFLVLVDYGWAGWAGLGWAELLRGVIFAGTKTCTEALGCRCSIIKSVSVRPYCCCLVSAVPYSSTAQLNTSLF